MKFSKFKIFYVAWLVVIFAYCLYGYFTGTGLSGWLIKLQFDYFGKASDKLTVFLGIAILMIPLEAARFLLRKKGLVDAPGEVPFDAKTWIKSLSAPKLAALVGVTLLPAAIGYAAYSYLYAENQERLKEPIYDIDLNADAAAKIENEHYVRLRGRLQENLTYTIEEGRASSSQGTSNENYTPLTAENWSATEPVRFIYYSKGYLPPNVTGRFNAPPKTSFEGQIINKQLPVYVRSKYEQAGLKIAAPYYLVEAEFFYQGKIPDRFYNSSAMVYLVGGIIASLIGIFLLIVWKIQPDNSGV